MRKPLLIGFYVIIISILAVAVWSGVRFYTAPLSLQREPLLITIPKGATAEQINTELQVKGATANLYYCLLLSKWLGQFKHIKAGEYLIPANFTAQQLLEKLIKGQVMQHKITFPEGWTFQQLIHAVQTNPNLSPTTQAQTAEQIMASIGHANQHPEGMFYPDTYLFTSGTKDTQILHLAYNLMQKKLAQAWATRAADTPYNTAYEALIVASLIEKESAVASERPRIAAVILHRLSIGMRLQIDAAVLYGLDDKSRHVLRRSDLSTVTPYNTYTQTGLPPTPIAMPGISSIQAALHPAAETALYYVAKGDGSHIFSANLQEHQIAAQAYRQHLALAQIAPEQSDNYLSYRASVQCFSAPLLMHYWRSLAELNWDN